MANFDIMIQVLVDFALRQDNECSWYGPLNLLLSQGLNGFGQKRRILTAVVPQLALAAILDEDDDDLLVSNVETSPDPLDAMFLPITATPSPSQRKIQAPSPSQPNALSSSHRTIAPSQRNVAAPSSQRGTTSELPDSPDPIALSYSPGSVRSMRKALRKLQDITSTRIPDFVRLRFYNYNTPSVRHRVDLIIEVKKLPNLTLRRVMVYRTLLQVRQQAFHAFEPDPQLLKLGCLIILGNEWMYTELGREDVSFSRGNRDSTYSEDSNPSSSGSATADPRTPPKRNPHAPIPPPPAAPDPDDMTELVRGHYLKFEGPSAPVRQRKMLKLINERLEVIDQSMVGSYNR